ncbi:MAG TPA: hypothetical protein VHK47_08350 [Polyangia bacterium]|jgi:hypothetical protein|nr:hypothetical protein [Polyangia bacterium]
MRPSTSSSNSRKKTISNVRIGQAEAHPTAPSHTRFVKQGNAQGSFAKEEGITPAPPGAQPDGARGSARRSTSINPGAREPIDPRMPRLSPA